MNYSCYESVSGVFSPGVNKKAKLFVCVEPCETSKFTFRGKPEKARKNWVGIIPGIILFILSVLSGNFLSTLLCWHVFSVVVFSHSRMPTHRRLECAADDKGFVVRLVLFCFVSGNNCTHTNRWWCWTRADATLLQTDQKLYCVQCERGKKRLRNRNRGDRMFKWLGQHLALVE